MKRAPSPLNPWVWPVNIERYDRTPELKRQEVEALERNLPRLEQGVLPFNVMREAIFSILLQGLTIKPILRVLKLANGEDVLGSNSHGR
jgi:hypothetical protein